MKLHSSPLIYLLQDVVRFWVERGVDGLRVDAVATMFEVEDLSLDEPPSGRPGFDDPVSILFSQLSILASQLFIFGNNHF